MRWGVEQGVWLSSVGRRRELAAQPVIIDMAKVTDGRWPADGGNRAHPGVSACCQCSSS